MRVRIGGNRGVRQVKKSVSAEISMPAGQPGPTLPATLSMMLATSFAQFASPHAGGYRDATGRGAWERPEPWSRLRPSGVPANGAPGQPHSVRRPGGDCVAVMTSELREA